LQLQKETLFTKCNSTTLEKLSCNWATIGSKHWATIASLFVAASVSFYMFSCSFSFRFNSGFVCFLFWFVSLIL